MARGKKPAKQHKLKGISALQTRFIDEYCVDKCAKQAAIRAGYKPGSAAVAGHRNLQNPIIMDAINKKLESLRDKYEVTAESVVREIEKEMAPTGGGVALAS